MLANKKRILITTHTSPDPDALGSSMALLHLLRTKSQRRDVHFSVKGQIGGGINDAFTRYANLDLVPWDERNLKSYDAIILLDTQPTFAYSPLPANVPATAVIDHHPARAKAEMPVLRHPLRRRRDQLDRLQLLHGAGEGDPAGPEPRRCSMRSSRILPAQRACRRSWTTWRFPA